MNGDRISWTLMAIFLASAAFQLGCESILAFQEGRVAMGLFKAAAALGACSFTVRAWSQR